MFPFRRKLPSRFEMLHQIRSIELRAMLIDRILIIHELLKLLEAFEVTSKTKTLVDNFFVYLEQSCQSLHTLNLRASWLLEYGGIIQDHLAVLEDRYIHHRIIKPELDNHALIDIVIELIEVVALYRVRVQAQYNTDSDILRILDEIIDAANVIDPSLNSHAYFELYERISDMTHSLLQFNEVGVMGCVGHEFSVVSRLIAIRYALENYTQRHSYAFS
jgi:hypothetical protein